jgi:hypothetical protein
LVDLVTLIFIEQQVALAGGVIGAIYAWKQLKNVKDLPKQFGDVMGEFAKTLKMSNLGKLSGESRQVQGFLSDIVGGELGKVNPMLAGIAEMPEIKRYLGKYPFLLPIIQGIAARYLSGLGQPGQPGLPRPSTTAEDIKRLQQLVPQ